MSAALLHPFFRDDLDVLAQAAPGKPDRHIVRDPKTGHVIELSSREIFLCRQMDGTTSLDDVPRRFREVFGADVTRENLEAFVRQLREAGFVFASRWGVEVRTWDTMRPLGFDADTFFTRMSLAFRWAYGWFAKVVGALLLSILLVTIGTYGPFVLQALANVFELIQEAAHPGSVKSAALLRIAVIVVLVPLVRELAKGTTCRHHGQRVPEVRFIWYMRFIPRWVVDLSAIFRLEKRERLVVASSGLVAELTIVSVAILLWNVLGPSNPVQALSLEVAIGASLCLFFNLNPFGQQDGSLLVSLAVERPDFRNRSVRYARAWLLRETPPEPLESSERPLFIAYGLASDAVSAVINVAVFGVLGYLLTGWMQGLGAMLALALVLLRFESSIWSAAQSLRPVARVESTNMATPKKSRSWLGWIIAAVVLLLLVIIPYPFEASGEFRVQPLEQRELRAVIEARIESIPVAEGAEVRAGDVVALLSKREVEANLESARASLRREGETLKLLEAGPRPEEVAVYEQRVKLAETEFKHSEAAYLRAKDLYAKQHITDQEYENAARQRDINADSLEVARRSLELSKAVTRPEQLDAQRAEVDRLRSLVVRLEDDLKQTTLVSPIDGRVTTLYLQGKVGQSVLPGDVVAVIQSKDSFVARVAVPEQFAGQVAVGADVRMKAWAHPSRVFEGKVKTLMPVIVEKSEDLLKQASVEQERGAVRNLNTPQEQVIPVLVEIEDAAGLLKTDMTGFAKIDAGWKPIGYALFHPVIRFFQVRVWSWIP